MNRTEARMRRDGWFGYQGTWAWVDLTNRTVRIEPAEAEECRQYIGGRGVQAHLVARKVASLAPLDNPLSPDNRLVIGSGPLNDTAVATAGRGSCSFISPLTRTPHGAAVRRCATRADSAWSGLSPGGMRRFSRAAARGTIADADPTTGGQSMPRMVTAGRAQSMSDTLPSPRSETPSIAVASRRNWSVG
jgi:hypothetical protein